MLSALVLAGRVPVPVVGMWVTRAVIMTKVVVGFRAAVRAIVTDRAVTVSTIDDVRAVRLALRREIIGSSGLKRLRGTAQLISDVLDDDAVAAVARRGIQ